jgi:hypothetical protein
MDEWNLARLEHNANLAPTLPLHAALARRQDLQCRTGGDLALEGHGVTPWTLYYWRERLTKEEHPVRRRRRSRRVTVAPVHVVTSADLGGGDLEVILAGGDRVRVRASASVDLVRRVIEVLRTAC